MSHLAALQITGPIFIGIYLGLLSLAVVAVCLIRRIHDSSRSLTAVPVPAQIDPFRIAYLRGGEQELTRTAIVDLSERGCIEPTDYSNGKRKTFPTYMAQGTWVTNIPQCDPTQEAPVQRELLEFFRTPHRLHEAVHRRFQKRIQNLTSDDKAWVNSQSLVHSSAFLWTEFFIALSLIVVLEGVLVYRFWEATTAGRSNVGFLFFSMLLTPLALMAPLAQGRLTFRGKKFLADLQRGMGELRVVKRKTNATEKGEFSFACVHSDYLLAMGVFGISALNGSDLHSMFLAFQRSSQSAGGCGVGCGGGCGGGGCGGCGG